VASGENVLLLIKSSRMTPLRKHEPCNRTVAGGGLDVGSVVAQLTQAISLATQANNGTENASDVKSVSNQISGILDEVQSLANTSYQGQYIFSGGQTRRHPSPLPTRHRRL